MTLPVIDSQGNLHRSGGPGGGQFAAKPAAPPLTNLTSDTARLRSRVRINWRHLVDPDMFEMPLSDTNSYDRKRPPARPTPASARDRSHEAPIQSFIANVSVRSYTAEQAPVTVVVDGVAGGDEVAREYRAVDGNLFRQVWGIQDPSNGTVIPISPASTAWAPTQAGETYDLLPVPADEQWLKTEAARADTTGADSEDAAHQLVQEHLDEFAAIDGHVWTTAPAPAYRAPTEEDAPFGAPLVVDVAPAPDTSEHAADIGFFPSDQYDDAVATMQQTAAVTGATVAPLPAEPPISWLRELGLIGDDVPWRRGVPMQVEPSETLTEDTFRDRLAAFREQIVTIPGAVTGDVGSFLVVGDWKLDFAALTRQQQDEYRRYIMYGVEHGLI